MLKYVFPIQFSWCSHTVAFILILTLDDWTINLKMHFFHIVYKTRWWWFQNVFICVCDEGMVVKAHMWKTDTLGCWSLPSTMLESGFVFFLIFFCVSVLQKFMLWVWLFWELWFYIDFEVSNSGSHAGEIKTFIQWIISLPLPALN